MNNYGFKKTINDLSGQQFGLWTVIKLAGRNKKREAQWLCRCQCGTERVISTYDLKHGRTYGCIKCAHDEGRAGNHTQFNAASNLDKVMASVERLCVHGIPLHDVLVRLQEERDKLNT